MINRRLKETNRSWPLKGLTRVVLTLYSATVIYWMFIGFGREVHTGGPLQYNLVPFRTVSLYFNLDNGLSLINRLVNLLGNVVVFIPFGFLSPLVKTRPISWPRISLYAVPCILLLECLQMLLHVGSFDIDDLLLNMLGVWTGYGLFRVISFRRNKEGEM
ncbi:VanZ family protein [Paenibacillus sp. G2S3]|uniref:VanZ family protein n=1 Tax=Paenibacillus sp. G2S3 TaxID=3047872 RepID=UPI0024C1E559|nr:VanZ family protein [Paenibacillus sp. G2S3]WHY21700.1 VanZ family protein [Paenibacillus sp. G2S3]